jgi:hypothetical protein
MPGKRWTTPEQTEFLVIRAAAFLAARADKRLPSFYASVYHDWFARWSERERLYPSSDDQPRVLTAAENLELQRCIAVKQKVRYYSLILCYYTEM